MESSSENCMTTFSDRVHQSSEAKGKSGELPKTKWKRDEICKLFCLPISIVCVIIFLLGLTYFIYMEFNDNDKGQCSNTCSLQLIETIPEGLTYENSELSNPSTFDTWMDFIQLAQKSIDIASYYWTLTETEIYPYSSSDKGKYVLQALLNAGTERGIKIRIAQNIPTESFPNTETKYLQDMKAAEVRSINLPELIGSGVLHTKFWIVDGLHAYIGSANLDWRSLTQVKELGIALNNCSCLAEDLSKIFEVYWQLGETAVLPEEWPTKLKSSYNLNHSMKLEFENHSFQAFLTSSPKSFNPVGRTNDIDGLLYVINSAKEFIYIAVMDYFPLMLYTPQSTFWPVIDDALKSVVIEKKVKVKMLISLWAHSRKSEDYFLRSLASINGIDSSVSLEIRRFVVPANESQQKIPFARVNHNKFMVTDNMAFIGTSNWSGDYFLDTAGVSFVSSDFSPKQTTSIRSNLQNVFERDWESEYSSEFL